MPTINTMPRIETTLVESYCGADGIASVSPMACIANANFNAIGVRIKTLQLSPHNVLRELKAAGKA